MLFVTGDSSGNKGDIGYESRHDTAYSLIASYLKLGRKQMQPNTSNLTHENSRLLMNTMFQNYPNLYIDGTHCPNLINDCNIATVDPNKPHHLLKDRSCTKWISSMVAATSSSGTFRSLRTNDILKSYNLITMNDKKMDNLQVDVTLTFADLKLLDAAKRFGVLNEETAKE